MPDPFRVGVTRDFLGPDGRITFGDIGLSLLDRHPGLSWEFLAEDTPELRPDQVHDYDALLVLGPRVTAATLEGVGRLAIVARFGVGYDYRRRGRVHSQRGPPHDHSRRRPAAGRDGRDGPPPGPQPQAPDQGPPHAAKDAGPRSSITWGWG